MAAFGLYAVDPVSVDDEFWLWPECEEPFSFWLSVQSQWATDQGVPTGLKYDGVRAAMSMAGVKNKNRAALFAQLQVMESACLHMWQRERK